MSVPGQYEIKVKSFAREMVTQFDVNRWRGGWRGHEMKDLFSWMRDEIAKLEQAVIDDDRLPVTDTFDEQKLEIRHRAADIANLCLIVADNANALRYDGLDADGEKTP